MSEIAVFGGSFDPPHIGHVLLAAYALSSTHIERVIVAPVYEHAFEKALGPFEHRLRMCELAFRDLKRVEVSDIERELGGVSRTLRLVNALGARHQGHRLRLLIGEDLLDEVARFQGSEEIRAVAPLLVVGREGFSHPELDPRALKLPDVSSTLVRSTLASGGDVSPWIPAQVATYIAQHDLYRGTRTP